MLGFVIRAHDRSAYRTPNGWCAALLREQRKAERIGALAALDLSGTKTAKNWLLTDLWTEVPAV